MRIVPTCPFAISSPPIVSPNEALRGERLQCRFSLTSRLATSISNIHLRLFCSHQKNLIKLQSSQSQFMCTTSEVCKENIYIVYI